MTLYKVLHYTQQQIQEVEYLLDIASILNCLNEVQESMFQFHPTLLPKEKQLDGFGEHEPFAIFHKSIIINEIVFKILENIYTTDYSLEDAINDQVWNEIYTPFILKTNLQNLSKEEIISLFKRFHNI